MAEIVSLILDYKDPNKGTADGWEFLTYGQLKQISEADLPINTSVTLTLKTQNTTPTQFLLIKEDSGWKWFYFLLEHEGPKDIGWINDKLPIKYRQDSDHKYINKGPFGTCIEAIDDIWFEVNYDGSKVNDVEIIC